MADRKTTPDDENPNPQGPDQAPDQPPAHPPNPAPPRAAKKEGWIEGLIMQTTGLPKDLPKPKATEEPTLWTYANKGFQFAGTTILFALMGYAMDRSMGWSPWGVVAMTFIGVSGGLYLLIKESLKDDSNAGPPKRPGRK